jgi:hypothetical protein
LTLAMMGYVALWILWGNTALVAIAAARRALDLHRMARAFRPAPLEAGSEGLFRGIVGGGGPVAQHAVQQNGRVASAAVQSIVWHDRSMEGSALAGEILLEAPSPNLGRLRIEPGPADVWLTEAEIEQSGQCKDAATFEDAYGHARRVKGFARTVTASIGRGRDAYVVGRLEADPDGEGFRVRPIAGRLILSTFDPARWARRRAAVVLFGFVPGIVLAAAGCTALALTEPVFDGLASKFGGLLGLAFFLAVLPAGTAVRDFLREPHARAVRGRWVHPTGAPHLVGASSPEKMAET